MKYMLLIYDNAGTREAFFAERDSSWPRSNAYATSSPSPASSSAARRSPTRRPPARSASSDGVPAVTDGPFVEAKEYFGGYLIVDCESIERATEIAPLAQPSPLGGAMEVRPLMDGGGSEM